MKKIILTILMLQIEIWCFCQQTYRTNEYGKTLYSLFSLNHKAQSYNIEDPSVITIQDLESKTNKEDIIVYIVYEINEEVKNSNATQPRPFTKLMDFYIVYDYNYKIYYSGNEKLKNSIPEIKIADGSTVGKMSIKYHFVNEKGNLDNKQIKKSAYEIKNENGVLSIQIDDKALIANSLLEIHAKIISRNFIKLKPSVSNIEGFEKHLVVSFPAIFNYIIPKSSNYELSSHSTSSFELLNFMHTSGVRNGYIEKINSVSQIYSWKVDLRDPSDTTPEFELNGIVFIPNTDIGIKETEILNIK